MELIQNVQSEVLFVGCFYTNPDLFIEYGRFIVSQYDLSDEVTRFLYDNFELYYTTFSQTVDETKVNTFMSQDQERLKDYKRYGGYKTIKQWMTLCDVDDFNNYMETVKKYSLLREFESKGFDVRKIMEHKHFNKMKAEDVVRLLRSAVDKVSTVIMADTSSVVVNKDVETNIKKWLLKPAMGASIPFPLLNELFRGLRLGKLTCIGFLSNEGKTRLGCFIAAYLAFVQGKKVAFLANETEEEDFRAALLTTIINNDCFKELHGIDIVQPERGIVLGQYQDDNGNIIERYCDEDGEYIETEEDYQERIYKNSKQFRDIIAIAEWMDNQIDGKIYFKFMKTYSDKDIDFEIRKHKLTFGVDYIFYDTLKNFKTSDWGELKQTTTMLNSISIELKVSTFCSFQLTDDTVFTDIFALSSNNIANAKQLKHVADHLILGKRLQQDEYHKFRYIPNTTEWGGVKPIELDLNKKYMALRIDKNRSGDRNKTPLLEFDLNLNVWHEIGDLVKAK